MQPVFQNKLINITHKEKFSRWLRNKNDILSWIVAVIVVAVLFVWLDIFGTLKLIQNISVSWLLLAIGLTFLGMVLRWLKWLVVLKKLYNWRSITTVFFLSKLVGGILPTRIGELAPLTKAEYRTKEVAALIIVDRFCETYATLLLGAMGLAFIGFAQRWIIISWGVIFVSISLLFFVLVFKDSGIFLQNLLPKHIYVTRFLNLMKILREGIQSLKPWLILLITLSVLGTVVDFLFVKFVFLSFGEKVSFHLVAAAWCITALASLVAFTPGGLGIADAPGLYLYSLYGVPEPAIGAGFILSRTIAMVFPWLYFLFFKILSFGEKTVIIKL